MGMIKVPTNSIDFFKKNIDEIFDTGNLAEGIWNSNLRQQFTKLSNAKYAIPFSSNGSGILAILMILKEYRGYKNIFIQSNTMYGMKTTAVTSGLNYLGAVNCSLKSLMPSIEDVMSFVDNLDDPEGTVFLISHIGGINNPDIAKIASFCNTKGIALIEDCAHSLGVTSHGKHSGTFGLAGIYSLYATKSIMAGEGGVAVTDDNDLASLIERFIIYDRFEQKNLIAVNFRISEIQALFSYSVCNEIQSIILDKSKIAKIYKQACDSKGIEFIDQDLDENKGNYYKFILKSTDSNPFDLSKIETKTSQVYDYSLGSDPESIVKKHICLPIWYGLEEVVVEKVVNEIYSI